MTRSLAERARINHRNGPSGLQRATRQCWRPGPPGVLQLTEGQGAPARQLGCRGCRLLVAAPDHTATHCMILLLLLPSVVGLRLHSWRQTHCAPGTSRPMLHNRMRWEFWIFDIRSELTCIQKSTVLYLDWSVGPLVADSSHEWFSIRMSEWVRICRIQ